MAGLWEMSKNPIYWHLIPGLNFFWKLRLRQLLNLLTPYFMQNFRKKTNEQFSRYLKTDRLTKAITVNPGSKDIILHFYIFYITLMVYR